MLFQDFWQETWTFVPRSWMCKKRSVGSTAQQCRLGLFQDSRFVGDLEDSESRTNRETCCSWESYGETCCIHKFRIFRESWSWKAGSGHKIPICLQKRCTSEVPRTTWMTLTWTKLFGRYLQFFQFRDQVSRVLFMSYSSSRSSWQDDMENLRLAKNQLLKSMKQFFQMTDKLIEDQRENGNLTTIDCKEPTWSANRSLESLPRPTGTQKSQETLHKERVIAVREEPSLHVEVTPARCRKCETQWWVVEHGVEESVCCGSHVKRVMTRMLAVRSLSRSTERCSVRWLTLGTSPTMCGVVWSTWELMNTTVWERIWIDRVDQRDERSCIFCQFLLGAFSMKFVLPHCIRRDFVFSLSPQTETAQLYNTLICLCSWLDARMRGSMIQIIGIDFSVIVSWNIERWLCLDTKQHTRTSRNRTSWYRLLAKTTCILSYLKFWISESHRWRADRDIGHLRRGWKNLTGHRQDHLLVNVQRHCLWRTTKHLEKSATNQLQLRICSWDVEQRRNDTEPTLTN